MFKVYHYIIFISIILCSIYFKKIKQQPYLIWLLFYLIITISIEIIPRYVFKIKNHVFFNLYLPVQFGYWCLLFYTAFESIRARLMLKYTSIVFLVFYFLNLILWQELLFINYYTIVLSSLILTTCSCYYFFEYAKSNEYIDLRKSSMFWLVSACMVFFVGIFIYFFSWDALVTKQVDAKGTLYKNLIPIINFIHYSMLLTAIFVQIKKTVKNDTSNYWS